MPQEFQVLQCYKCETFQVHQVKKTTKWQCKLCGEKQSLKKVYGRGTGSECRCHVQKLNTMRGELKTALSNSSYEDRSDIQTDPDEWDHGDHQSQMNSQLQEESKWKMFVDRDVTGESDVEVDDVSIDSMFTTDAAMFKRGKKRKRINKGRTNTDNNDVHGAAKYRQNVNQISKSVSSQRMINRVNNLNDGNYDTSSNRWAGFSVSEEFRSNDQLYTFNDKELNTRPVQQNEHRDTQCVIKNPTKVRLDTSTKLPEPVSSKWNNYILADESSSQCDSINSVHDNFSNQTNKYDPNIDNLVDKENNMDSRLLGNQTQENKKLLNKSDPKKFSTYGQDNDLSVTSSRMLRNQSVESSGHTVELKQSRWSSYLNSETKSVVTSSCESSATSKPAYVNKPVKPIFTVEDLSDEDFNL